MTSTSHANETPTLRLVTLRRLLAGAPPPIVIDPRATVAAIERRRRIVPGARVVVVDGARIVRGTVEPADLRGVPAFVRAEAILSTRFIALEPEDDADTALAALAAHDADRVLVIARAGDLLGVLDTAELSRR